MRSDDPAYIIVLTVALLIISFTGVFIVNDRIENVNAVGISDINRFSLYKPELQLSYNAQRAAMDIVNNNESLRSMLKDSQTLKISNINMTEIIEGQLYPTVWINMPGYFYQGRYSEAYGMVAVDIQNMTIVKLVTGLKSEFPELTANEKEKAIAITINNSTIQSMLKKDMPVNTYAAVDYWDNKYLYPTVYINSNRTGDPGNNISIRAAIDNNYTKVIKIENNN